VYTHKKISPLAVFIVKLLRFKDR